MKTAPKKTDQINIRGSDADLGAFRRLCDESGFETSEIIRDLMRAALAYIPAYCANGRWYPPRLSPYTVAITRERGAAAFTLSHPEYGPLVTCVLCGDDDRAEYAWTHCERLYLQIMDDLAHAGVPMTESVMQLPPRPEGAPWLAVILTGAALVIPTDAIGWAGDFERCLAWTILEADRH